jgi:phosphoribosylglycinamide formyltransferase 1
MPIEPGDTEAGLAARLLPLEHRLLVATVQLLASARVTLEGDRVLLDGYALDVPLQLGEHGWLPR